jgi:hypothetical protein
VMRRVAKVEMTFFIAVDGGSRAVRGRWTAVKIRIQCFSFGLRGEAMGRSVAIR